LEPLPSQDVVEREFEISESCWSCSGLRLDFRGKILVQLFSDLYFILIISNYRNGNLRIEEKKYS
jgi:hypothetical protein